MPHLITPDGRRLSYETTGDPKGYPVLVAHGTPGSMTGIRPRNFRLSTMAIRWTSWGRPGFDGSDRLEGREVAHAAADAAALADHLEHEEFAVMGRSGGTPHALACAALLGKRVTAVGCFGGLSPREDADWVTGMAASNVAAFANSDEQAVINDILGRTARAARDPASILRELEPEMMPSDRLVLADPGIRRRIVASYAAGLKNGPYGWLDDVLSLRKPWGFDPADIRCPVRLWVGEDDPFTPLHHIDMLSAMMVHAEVDIERGASHFDAIERMPMMLVGLVNEQARAEQVRQIRHEIAANMANRVEYGGL